MSRLAKCADHGLDHRLETSSYEVRFADGSLWAAHLTLADARREARRARCLMGRVAHIVSIVSTIVTDEEVSA